MSWLNNFLNRPVLTSVIFIIALLIGGTSMATIPVEDEPSVSYNEYNINVGYSSSLEGVESAVVLPLEQNLLSIPGVELVFVEISVTGANINVIFSPNTERYENILRLQDAVASCRPDIPHETIINIGSDTRSTEDIYAMYFYSEKLNKEEVGESIQKFKYLLESLNGVSSVRINSSKVDTWTLNVMPTQMKNACIATSDIKNTIHNFGATGGSSHILVGNSIVQANVILDNYDLATFPVLNKQGNVVYLGDIAFINKGPTHKDSSYRINGREVSTISVFKKPEANLIQVCKSVGDLYPTIEQMAKSMELKCGVYVDRSVFVQNGINSVYHTILESIVLVGIVILIFLRSLRIALIPLLAIPLSIIPMTAVMKGVGTSFNIYSLFGIVLAIGLVVDDAIIVIENIFKYLERGHSLVDAIIQGTTTIVTSIVSMTITLAVVYLPILFVFDPSIKNFVDFAIAIAVSVLFSGVVSIIGVPVIFYVLHKNYTKPIVTHNTSGKKTMLDRVEDFYCKMLAIAINYRYTFFGSVYFVLILGLVFCMTVIKYEENIEVDKGDMHFYVNTKLENDIDISYTDDKLSAMVDKIRNLPIADDIQDIITSAQASDKSYEYLRLKLVDHKKRKHDVSKIMNAINNCQSDEVADIRIFNISGTADTKTISTYLQCYDDSYANLVRKLRQYESFPLISKLFVDSYYSDCKYINTYTFKINRDICCAYGIDPTSIVDTLSSLQPSRVFKKPIAKNVHKLRLAVHAPNTPDKIEEILSLGVHVRVEDAFSADKKMINKIVPLRNFVKVSTTKELNRKNRINGLSGLRITFRLRPGVSKKDFKNAVDEFNKIYGSEAFAKIAPRELRVIESMSRMLKISILAIVLIYLIISALLESFVKPISILATVPLSMFGGVGLLWLLNFKMNVIAILGLITLVGLITKHGIMLVDYINNNDDGALPLDILTLKAGLVRFRPIIMTTICMIIGAIPLARSTGQEFYEYKQPIAIVIIGGMFVGTILTLFIVPCVHIIVMEFLGTKLPKRANHTVMLNILQSDMNEEKLASKQVATIKKTKGDVDPKKNKPKP